MAHHTKGKGDLGVAKAHADLVARGWLVLFPTTEHAPFDLVAYRDGEFQRVQVKYRSAESGKLYVKFSSVSADRNGTHIQPIDKAAIDVVCVYCPETDLCYYLDPTQFRSGVTLRVRVARNGQQRRIREAERFLDFPVLVEALTDQAGRPRQDSNLQPTN